MTNPPEPSTRLLGLRTVIYHVGDLTAATAWYARVLGFAPYFEQPFYVGFQVGGYELGLLPPEPEGPAILPGGSPNAYWGVGDAPAAFARLVALGATAHETVYDVGDGVRLGTVTDPWGNLFGIIENPHFVLPAAPANQP